MSLRSYQTKDGVRHQVQWRDHQRKLRGRTFTSKTEAIAFDADIKSKKFRGETLPRPGKETLAVAYEEWFRLRGATLASTTQRTYQAVWDAHIRGRFDQHTLAELAAEPRLFEELLADMRERGVGNAAQRKTLTVMSAVLTAAVDWHKLSANPLWRMRKPPTSRKRLPHPFPPVVVERIRLRMMRRRTLDSTGLSPMADAVFVGLLAYAGLRPGEALALQWADIHPHTIAVDKAVRDGQEAPTKTGAIRTVPLIGPLHEDLDALRMAAGMPGPDGLVLPAEDGGHWSPSKFRNWRARIWQPALKDIAGHHTLASLKAARPYDCRHTFVSLHLRAGTSPLDVAQWAGHSPSVMFRVYSHTIAELRGEPIVPVELAVYRARIATEEVAREKLDQMTADILAKPTVTAGGEGSAASFFYAPPKP